MRDFMKNYFIENAKRIGESTAKLVASNNLPITSEEVQRLAKRYQAKVVIVPLGDKASNPKVRAIYDRNMKLIAVEEASLIELKLSCELSGLGPVSRSDILAIHIAHELFHHLEETGKVPLSMYYNFKNQYSSKKLFNVASVKSIVSRFYKTPSLVLLREVAAHSFVKTLLGLSISPECIEKRH